MDKTINISTDKDIGVIIDDQLSFSEHFNEKINKANRIVWVIRSFVHLDPTQLLSPNSLPQIFKPFVVAPLPSPQVKNIEAGENM